MLKKIGAKIIGLTGGVASPMGEVCDVVIDVGVEREACPMGMAPTASTTAALAMGDALAVALINRRRFNQDDFKRFHPGGSLGERLTIKVSEIMRTNERIPMVPLGSKVHKAIEEIDAKKIGATLIIGKDRKLEGIISDGDLRRALLRQKNIHKMRVEDIMSPTPKTIGEGQTAAEALGLMEMYAITHLVIVDWDNRVKGVVHLHDLLGRKDFKINGGFNFTKRADR
jgi:arabinose-5-phosphate isomerase